MSASEPVKIFYSYSHLDGEWRRKLDGHLAYLRRKDHLTWYDGELILGQDVNEEIRQQLDSADVILLLVSSRFLNSSYCYDVELKRAMERHERGEVAVGPILLSDCVWQDAPFAKLLIGPEDAKPIDNSSKWVTEDAALTDAAKKIGKLVEAIQGKKAAMRIQTPQSSIERSVNPKSEQASDEDIVAAVKLHLEKKRQLTFSSTSEERNEVRNLFQKILKEIDIQDTIDNIPSLGQDYPLELFKSIYAQEKLTKQVKEEVLNVRNSDKYHWYHRSLIVSALTLSVINFKTLDPNKVLLLIDFINDHEDRVWQKALTGVTLSLSRTNSWVRNEPIRARLEAMKHQQDVQLGLKMLAHIVELGIYKIFQVAETVYTSNRLFDNPGNYFFPFHENNSAITYFYENSKESDPQGVVDAIQNAPFPDFLKYAYCYNAEQKTPAKRTNGKYLAYLYQLAHFYNPYLQHVNELFNFYQCYPALQKEKLLAKEFSLANNKLKHIVFNEIEKHRLLAVHYQGSKDTQKAIDEYKQILRLNEKEIEALKDLATCYKQVKNFEEELLVRYRIESIEYTVVNRLATAFALTKLRRFKTSQECCEKLLEEKTNEAVLYMIMSENYHGFEEYDKGLEVINKSIEMGASNSDIYYSRAVLNYKLENYELALEDITISIELDLEDPQGYDMRSIILRHMDRLDEAEADSQKALSLEPSNIAFLNSYALVLMSKRDFPKALLTIEKALNKTKAKDGNALACCIGTHAVIYSLIGEEEKFYELLEEALSKGGEAQSLEKAIKEKYKSEPRFVELLEKYHQSVV